jgi:hypothetical protein
MVLAFFRELKNLEVKYMNGYLDLFLTYIQFFNSTIYSKNLLALNFLKNFN